jgi:glycosyltransferase involved in cell wall biosynthesis
MRRAVFVVPGGLDRVTGGNVYDRAVIDAMRGRGWTVHVAQPGELDESFDVAVIDSLAFWFGRPQIRTPYVALVHQLPSAVQGFPEPNVQERDVFRFADLVITVGEWLRDEVSRFTSRPVEVIEPGRDRAWAVDGRSEDADTVLSVANAVPGKGVPDAIEAFSRARAGDARLSLVGDLDVDPDEARHVREAMDASDASIDVAGVTGPDGLARAYENARVLIAPTRYEGRPIAVAEAMASGVPVAGYDVPGMRELVRHGRDGLLARMGDVDELADCLGDLLRTPALADGMGANARRRALEWPTWQDTGERFADAMDRFEGSAQETVAR